MGVPGLALKPALPRTPLTPQEKLKYFPVCMHTKPEPEAEAEEGLGGLPSNVSSVSSLLLFNTTENLYGQRGAAWGAGSSDSAQRKSVAWGARPHLIRPGRPGVHSPHTYCRS